MKLSVESVAHLFQNPQNRIAVLFSFYLLFPELSPKLVEDVLGHGGDLVG